MNDDTKFLEWMKKVDKAIANKLCGLTSADLPDCCYRAFGVGRVSKD